MHTRLVYIHSAMKRRCYSPECKDYKNYGGRGITVCSEWLSTEKIAIKDTNLHNCTKGFIAFKEWALSNGYIEGLTLDRIDNNKGYSPDNCRWITRKEQNINKRSNHIISYKGQKHTISEWAEIYGISYSKLLDRINKNGLSLEEAISCKGNKNERLLTYKGKTQSMVTWSSELSIPYTVLRARLNRSHWTVKEAFETPYEKGKHNRKEEK